MGTYVCYHVPSDRDDPDHPNVFTLSKPAEEILLKDIKDAFPLPGNYHFRFKVKLDHGYYWLDLADDNANLPAHSHKRIVAKVLRISWNPGPTKHVPAPLVRINPPPPSIDIFSGVSPKRSNKIHEVAHSAPGVSDLDLFS